MGGGRSRGKEVGGGGGGEGRERETEGALGQAENSQETTCRECDIILTSWTKA